MKTKWMVLAAAAAMASLAQAQNRGPDLTDYARSADGKIQHMTQSDADKYCRARGQRLPTARELAHYAESFGAGEISETPKDDYYPLPVSYELSDSSSNPYKFYFTEVGFLPPGGFYSNWAEESLWSSSMVRSGDHYNGVRLETDSGWFGTLDPDDHNAVRCVQK